MESYGIRSIDMSTSPYEANHCNQHLPCLGTTRGLNHTSTKASSNASPTSAALASSCLASSSTSSLGTSSSYLAPYGSFGTSSTTSQVRRG